MAKAMTMQEKENRFSVRYRITVGDGQTIEQIARDIAVEQTVEIPYDCIPDEHLRRGIIGEIEHIRHMERDSAFHDVQISYPTAAVGRDIPQFLNVLFGNISLKSNIQITDFSYPHEHQLFPGPSYGISGIRNCLGVHGRPLTCTAIKPLGLSTGELAQRAGEFAAGGVDFIKDDHGLSDQTFHPFYERVARCQEEIQRRNAQTGGHTMYCPMVSGGFDRIMRQVEYALSCGVRAILIAPMLVGMDTMRYISQTCGPIILAHPSFTGTHFHDRNHGMKPAVMLGKLFRLAGADASIFPNAGGRFGFTRQECDDLADSLRLPIMGSDRLFRVRLVECS
ncbi:MAG: RuBisCO large subunit C-terminal-like domain-containing protein [Chitinivibrionales bacterium]